MLVCELKDRRRMVTERDLAVAGAALGTLCVLTLSAFGALLLLGAMKLWASTGKKVDRVFIKSNRKNREDREDRQGRQGRQGQKGQPGRSAALRREEPTGVEPMSNPAPTGKPVPIQALIRQPYQLS